MRRVDLCRIDGQDRSVLVAGNGNRNRADLERECACLRAVIHSAVALLRRRSRAAIDQMKLVAKIVALSIVADDRSVGQAESLSRLLTDRNTGCRLAFAVALCEFIRI